MARLRWLRRGGRRRARGALGRTAASGSAGQRVQAPAACDEFVLTSFAGGCGGRRAARKVVTTYRCAGTRMDHPQHSTLNNFPSCRLPNRLGCLFPVCLSATRSGISYTCLGGTGEASGLP